jgi:hypothetical protein
VVAPSHQGEGVGLGLDEPVAAGEVARACRLDVQADLVGLRLDLALAEAVGYRAVVCDRILNDPSASLYKVIGLAVEVAPFTAQVSLK